MIVLIGGASLLAASSIMSCREPTQVTIAITTDVPCSQLRTVTVTVGKLGEIETKDPAVSSSFCDPSGNIGTLVIVPSGDDDEQVAMRVIGGNGKDAEQCVAPNYGPQCIVARRALRYLPHASLTVPIALRVTCDGIPCSPTETCVKGLCKSALIEDPEKCRDGCDEDTLGASPDNPSGDSGITITDASSDAQSRDAGPVVFGGGGACADDDGGAYEPASPWPVRGGCSAHRSRSGVVGPAFGAVTKWSVDVGFAYDRASTSPVVGADGTIYVGGRATYAIRPDGTQKWSMGGASTATPVVAATALLTTSNNHIEARDKNDGHLIWTGPAMQTGMCSPVLGRDGTIYSAGSGPFLGAIHSDGSVAFGYDGTAPVSPLVGSPGVTKTGSVHWQIIAGGSITSTLPDGGTEWTASNSAPSYDWTMVGTDDTAYSATSSLLALYPDGATRWSVPTVGGNVGQAVALGNDVLLVPASDAGVPTLTAFDPTNGVVAWSFQLDGDAGPVTVDGEGTAYFGTTAGTIYAVSATGGLVDIDAAQQFEAAVPQQEPLVPLKQIRTGQLKWKIPLGPGHDARAPMALGKDGTLYAVIGDGKLYAIGNP